MNVYTIKGHVLQSLLLSCMVLAALVPAALQAEGTVVTSSVTISSQSSGESHASIDVVSTVNGGVVTDVHLEESSQDGEPLMLRHTSVTDADITEDQHETVAATSHESETHYETTELGAVLKTLAALLERMITYVSLL